MLIANTLARYSYRAWEGQEDPETGEGKALRGSERRKNGIPIRSDATSSRRKADYRGSLR